jgi:hypothetical protein
VDLDDTHRRLLTGCWFSLNGLPAATLPRPPGRRTGVSERLFPYRRQRRSWTGIDDISGVFDNGLFSGDAAYGPQEKAIGLVARQLDMIMKRGSQMIGSIQPPVRLRNTAARAITSPCDARCCGDYTEDVFSGVIDRKVCLTVGKHTYE